MHSPTVTDCVLTLLTSLTVSQDADYFVLTFLLYMIWAHVDMAITSVWNEVAGEPRFMLMLSPVLTHA